MKTFHFKCSGYALDTTGFQDFLNSDKKKTEMGVRRPILEEQALIHSYFLKKNHLNVFCSHTNVSQECFERNSETTFRGRERSNIGGVEWRNAFRLRVVPVER